MKMVKVRFVQGAIVEGVQYNLDDGAAFDADLAKMLYAQQVAIPEDRRERLDKGWHAPPADKMVAAAPVKK